MPSCRGLALFAFVLAGCSGVQTESAVVSRARPDRRFRVATLEGVVRRSDDAQRWLVVEAREDFGRRFCSLSPWEPGGRRVSGVVRMTRPRHRALSTFSYELEAQGIGLHGVSLDDGLAPGLGTVLVAMARERRLVFALTLDDAVVQVRQDDVEREGARAFPARGRTLEEIRVAQGYHADVDWVLSSLDGRDPVLRLHALDVLGAELVPVEQFTRDTADMAWHAGLVAVRADARVHARVLAARSDPEPWIAEAAAAAAERLGL